MLHSDYRPPNPAPSEDLIARFAAIVGVRYAIRAPAEMARYLDEPRDLFHGKAALVLRPGSTEEVAAILRLANETGTAIIPQGGNTGLVGGQVPHDDGTEIILSLGRLNRIREVDAEGGTLVAEAGVVLTAVQNAADAAGLLFPLSLGSEGSCTVGGNLSTNAGGTAVLAYGNARELVLGLEVVLADGRIWNGLGRLRKDNTGYDLKHLFMGAEGTLGVITAAVLKLFPKPKAVTTAFIGLDSPHAALALLGLARQHLGAALTTFEVVPRIGIDFVLKHGNNTRDPLGEPHAWYVLAEGSFGDEAQAQSGTEALLEEALEKGIVADAAIAASEAQREQFWGMRHILSEVQSREGGSIKHDVSVPVAAVPAFIDAATAAVEALIPGARVIAFGHLGDGNIHFNVSQPVGGDKAAFLAGWDAVNECVHAIVAEFSGSISAEHGIGRMKRDLLPRFKDPVALAVMRQLKATLDPNGILNPGKVL